MKRRDQLDEVLYSLSKLNIDNKPVSIVELPQTEKLDIPEVESALEKLISIGYVGLTTENGYYMKFDGWIALEGTPFLFRNKPFKYISFKENLITIWKIVKIIGIILNATAIIYIGILSLKKNDRTEIIKKEIIEAIESKSIK